MDFHILSTHQRDKDDATPLQLVSAEQIAYWRRVEADYVDLLEKLAAADKAQQEVLAPPV